MRRHFGQCRDGVRPLRGLMHDLMSLDLRAVWPGYSNRLSWVSLGLSISSNTVDLWSLPVPNRAAIKWREPRMPTQFARIDMKWKCSAPCSKAGETPLKSLKHKHCSPACASEHGRWDDCHGHLRSPPLYLEMCAFHWLEGCSSWQGQAGGRKIGPESSLSQKLVVQSPSCRYGVYPLVALMLGAGWPIWEYWEALNL